MYWKFLKSILLHKWYVLKAGVFLGIPLWRLVIHDWTKFLPVEFLGYARWFFGEKEIEGWVKAWRYHQQHNKHHPEYWLFSWRVSEEVVEEVAEQVSENVFVLPMPEVYVREMVADFMGASKTYSGSYDMTKWLNDNGPKMILHRETMVILSGMLIDLDFFLTDNCPWSWCSFGPKFRSWLEKQEGDENE